MANKWMIAAVTAALFSGADWFAAARLAGTPQVAAPALSAPATTQQPLAASRDDAEASRKARS